MTKNNLDDKENYREYEGQRKITITKSSKTVAVIYKRMKHRL